LKPLGLPRRALTGDTSQSIDENTSQKLQDIVRNVTLEVAAEFIENFNVQMLETAQRLIDSDRRGYDEIIRGIRDLQDYLAELVSPSTEDDRNRLDPRQLPGLINRAISADILTSIRCGRRKSHPNGD
jgi:hypothetical protein